MKRHNTRGLCSGHHRQRERGVELTELQPRAKSGTRVCQGPECRHGARIGPLCPGHYQQQRKGQELQPLRSKQSSLIRDDQGRKRCRGCQLWLAESNFTGNKSSRDGLDGYCTLCRRAGKTMAAYNLTSDQYDAMLAAQNNGCAICRGVNESGRALAVDHDHACCPGTKTCGACIRGLLCSPCNNMLGLARDSQRRLRDAADYLSRYQ